MIQQIKTLSSKHFDDLVRLRQHLHQFPELSFQETNTTAHIISEIKHRNLDVEIHEQYAETGVVVILKGATESSKCIALRADIDALPIQEKTNLPYQSVNKGVMHACGHDVHTASLFGALLILHDCKEDWQGSVKFIFQPGEELLPGGASVLIKNGVLHDPQVNSILGQHVFTDLPVGKVGFRSGLYMASADELHTTITGVGGHAALATEVKDPIEAMNYLLIALRKTIEKHSNDIPSVIAFGKIEAQGATNVIPEQVNIKGTFRTVDEKWRKEAHELMEQTAVDIANRFGVQIDLGLLKGYPCLVNDKDITHSAKKLAKQYLGDENVIDLPLRMSSEDFAFYSHEVPGCFYRLGTSKSENEISTPVHTSTFYVDNRALEIGAGLMAWLAYNQLK